MKYKLVDPKILIADKKEDRAELNFPSERNKLIDIFGNLEKQRQELLIIHHLTTKLLHTTGKYKKMVEWIAKDLEVTTLRYQNVDDMVRAIGLPKENLCLYCWTGECPKRKKLAEKQEGKELHVAHQKV